MSGAKRSSDSRVEVPAADVGHCVKHDGEREAVSDGSRSQSVLSSIRDAGAAEKLKQE